MTSVNQSSDQGAGLPTRRALREHERASQHETPASTRRGRHVLETTSALPLTRREMRQLERTEREEAEDSQTGKEAPIEPAPPADEPIAPNREPEPTPIQVTAQPTLAPIPRGWPAAVNAPGAETRPIPVSRPVLPGHRSTGPSAGRAARRTPRIRAAIALSFSALLVAGTSLSATNASLSFASTPPVAELEPQELLTVAATQAQAISRDGYSVTEPEVLAEAKAAVAGYRTANTFTNNPTSAIQWPFPVGVPISDGFGPRESPGGIGSTNHKGVDFTPGQGTPVNAVAAGVVRLVQETDEGGLGVYGVIDHVIDGVNVSSWYGHMLTGSLVVTEGQVVLPGQ